MNVGVVAPRSSRNSVSTSWWARVGPRPSSGIRKQFLAKGFALAAWPSAVCASSRRSNWRWPPVPPRRAHQARTPGWPDDATLVHATFRVRPDFSLFHACRAATLYARIHRIDPPGAPPAMNRRARNWSGATSRRFGSRSAAVSPTRGSAILKVTFSLLVGRAGFNDHAAKSSSTSRSSVPLATVP